MEQAVTPEGFAFNIAHQEKYSRGELLLRTFFGFIYLIFPHLFLLFFVGVASALLTFLAFWAVLFTGVYPRFFFDFQVAVLRWQTRVNARMLNLADGYPAFGMDGSDDRSLLEIPYPANVSRGLLLVRLFFGFFYVLIPHGICLFFRMIATHVVVFIAWWVVLITGEYPKGLHDFVVGTLRWALRVNLYFLFLTDKYPPFSGK